MARNATAGGAVMVETFFRVTIVQKVSVWVASTGISDKGRLTD
jgi:hypothetical protein